VDAHSTSGRIILLNGTSSAGKTTLALALQRTAHEYWHYWALDQFRDGMPNCFRGLNSSDDEPGSRGLNVVPVDAPCGRLSEIRFGDLGTRMLRGMRRAAASFAREGVNVVIDDLCLEPAYLDDYLAAFDGIDVIFVGLRCAPETLLARESARLDRFPGTAIHQDARVHRRAVYDLEIDTSKVAPEAGVEKLLERLREGPGAAFEHMRKMRRAGHAETR